jgi:hypothetical protein
MSTHLKLLYPDWAALLPLVRSNDLARRVERSSKLGAPAALARDEVEARAIAHFPSAQVAIVED